METVDEWFLSMRKHLRSPRGLATVHTPGGHAARAGVQAATAPPKRYAQPRATTAQRANGAPSGPSAVLTPFLLPVEWQSVFGGRSPRKSRGHQWVHLSAELW